MSTKSNETNHAPSIMYHTYIPTEAMTTARVQVFYVVYFQAEGYTDQNCNKSIDYTLSF